MRWSADRIGEALVPDHASVSHGPGQTGDTIHRPNLAAIALKSPREERLWVAKSHRTQDGNQKHGKLHPGAPASQGTDETDGSPTGSPRQVE